VCVCMRTCVCVWEREREGRRERERVCVCVCSDRAHRTMDKMWCVFVLCVCICIHTHIMYIHALHACVIVLCVYICIHTHILYAHIQYMHVSSHLSLCTRWLKVYMYSKGLHIQEHLNYIHYIYRHARRILSRYQCRKCESDT